MIDLQSLINKKEAFALFRLPYAKQVGFIKAQENASALFSIQSFDSQIKINIPYAKVTYFNAQINTHFIDFEAPTTKNNNYQSCTFSNYNALFSKAMEAIQIEQLQKIVLSRIIVKNQAIKMIDSYQNLLQIHPQAMCYLLYHPDLGIWMGATPELLLDIENNELKTMSLAGTKLVQDSWGEKEFLEQEIVTRYIVQQIKPFSNNIHINQLETIKSGSLHHLLTRITAKITTNTIEQLIQKLHPTPAVCGFPLIASKNFILDNEQHARSLYTGFLGFKRSNKLKLFVNLRCTQIFKDAFILYVGGGINAQSNVEKEWQEMENKSQTILSSICYA